MRDNVLHTAIRNKYTGVISGNVEAMCQVSLVICCSLVNRASRKRTQTTITFLCCSEDLRVRNVVLQTAIPKKSTSVKIGNIKAICRLSLVVCCSFLDRASISRKRTPTTLTFLCCSEDLRVRNVLCCTQPFRKNPRALRSATSKPFFD